MRTLRFVGAGLVALMTSTGFSKTCTWIGGAGDTKWSSPENWDTPPVSGNGDTVVLQSGVGGELGEADFSIKQLCVLGSEAVTIGGTGSLILEGGANVNYPFLTNSVPLTVNVPVKLGGDTGCLAMCEEVTYNKLVSTEATGFIRFGSKKSSQKKVVLNAGFHGPNAKVTMGQGASSGVLSNPGVWFYGPLIAKSVGASENYFLTCVELCTTGNVWDISSVCYGHMRAECEGAFPVGSVLDWGNTAVCTTRYLQYAQEEKKANPVDRSDFLNCYDLNGFDQTIDRIQCSNYPSTTKSVFDLSYTVFSKDPACLTMRATDDGLGYLRFCGAISFNWAPLADHTFVISNNVQTMTGSVTVSNGTVKAVGTCAFPSVPDLTVNDDATFDLDSESTDALKSLKTITLGQRAKLRIGPNAVTPFADATVDLCVRHDSRIELPPAVVLKASFIVVDGVYCYGTNITEGIVTGGGKITVNARPDGKQQWKAVRDGSWGTAENWTGDAVPASDDRVALDVYPGAYQATIDMPMSHTGDLALWGRRGGEPTLAVSNAFTYVGTNLSVLTGARLLVGETGTLAITPPASAKGGEPFVIRGGRLTVDGGTADLTGGSSADKSDENFHGQLTVEGADGQDGVLEVRSGLFKMIPWWGGVDGNVGSRIRIREGGRIRVSGGVFDIRSGWWWNEPLVMEGGDIEVSNDGKMIIDCRSTNGSGTAGYFGTGSVTFKDSSELAQPINAQASIYWPATRDSEPRALGLSFTDHARLNCCGGLYLGGYLNAPVKKEIPLDVTLTLDSDADHVVGRMDVGVNIGDAELNLAQGSLSVTNGALHIPRHANFHKGNTPHVNLSGKFNMTGGSLYVKGKASLTSTSPNGFLLGNTLPLPSSSMEGLTTIDTYSGTFNLMDGAVTNDAGFVIVGAGMGTGVFHQEGGSFEHRHDRQCSMVGFLGGHGTYEMTGGTSVLKGDFYVGGALTNTIGWGKLETTGRYEGAFIDLTTSTVCRATGLLRVTDGAFSLIGETGRLVFSDDGVGNLEIGATGSVSVKGLDFRNGRSTARFVFGPSGVGTVTVSGDMAVSAGTKLEIDMSQCTAEQGSFKLFDVGGTFQPFDENDITLVGTKQCRILQKTTGVELRIRTGMIMIVR